MSWSLRLGFPRLAVAVALLAPAPAISQTARISEEIRVLDTYPFSEPNPVPILVRDARLYPYHSFEGYAATSRPQEWKVVTLENEYIRVFVLPEVGGKVWGAVVKETGHEFIYRNEVMKFRNIALRGPWTSGGIEFNFGVIGHTPSTATPVDYTLVDNPDGSVSCWVGAMDLPSRTHWRVEIRLPADRAVFETNVLWYNPTPLEQPYYNWMTAAAFAQDDLEMSIPGNAYLQHSGQVEKWPVDQEGRYLPLYANNTFDGHKSYHVVGELNDFFGGYYHDEDYGFGHWARYEDMPGQKLWLWALSREGGIWEELLTDTDGQYVEFQAGRLFVQYSPGSAVNPITQVGFDPMSASRWTETWFPLEGTGGLTDASREGAMFVSAEGGRLTVGINAFRDVQDTLKIWSDLTLVLAQPLDLQVLKPFETSVEIPEGRDFRIALPGLDLDYSSDPAERRLSRPFATDEGAWEAVPAVDRAIFQARELMKGRRYAQARGIFEEVLAEEPWNRETLLGLAELSYRRGLFKEGLEYANRALQIDAYDAEANFLAGVLYRVLCKPADARDSFGWAARSTAFRSASYVQLAELKVIEASALGWWRLAKQATWGGVDVDPEVFRADLPSEGSRHERAWSEAIRYARLAIESDRHSVPAWQVLAIVGRNIEDEALIQESRSQLLALDPLHHFVAAEEYLSARGEEPSRGVLASFGGEYPDQTVLELAIEYANLGLAGDALSVLGLGARGNLGGGPLQQAWGAALDDGPSRLLGSDPPDFAFPYRVESLPVLRWATENSDDWVWDYLLAMNLWALDRAEEAGTIMEGLGDTPDYAPFYVVRSHLRGTRAPSPESGQGPDAEADLRRAVELDPENRIVHIYLIRHLQEARLWQASLDAVARARPRFPDDFNLDLLEARALVSSDRGEEAAEILARTHVLPSENARESHLLFEQAHSMVAMDAFEAGDFAKARQHLLTAMEWPEHLGQGRPYQPDERLVRFILSLVEARLGNVESQELDPTLRAELQAMAEASRGEVEKRLIQRALRLGGGDR
jgi:tetratricopeptide (TPR) repeat protein